MANGVGSKYEESHFSKLQMKAIFANPAFDIGEITLWLYLKRKLRHLTPLNAAPATCVSSPSARSRTIKAFEKKNTIKIEQN